MVRRSFRRALRRFVLVPPQPHLTLQFDPSAIGKSTSGPSSPNHDAVTPVPGSSRSSLHGRCSAPTPTQPRLRTIRLHTITPCPRGARGGGRRPATKGRSRRRPAASDEGVTDSAGSNRFPRKELRSVLHKVSYVSRTPIPFLPSLLCFPTGAVLPLLLASPLATRGLLGLD
jgi:hypothetical protein